jgi:hypothetical protein
MTTISPGYGIIAYVPTRGKFPRDDEAHFDGWYASRAGAQKVFEDFVKRYPTALIHVVELVASEWRGAPTE